MLITECCIASAGSSGLGTKTYWLVKSRRRNQSVLGLSASDWRSAAANQILYSMIWLSIASCECATGSN